MTDLEIAVGHTLERLGRQLSLMKVEEMETVFPLMQKLVAILEQEIETQKEE